MKIVIIIENKIEKFKSINLISDNFEILNYYRNCLMSPLKVAVEADGKVEDRLVQFIHVTRRDDGGFWFVEKIKNILNSFKLYHKIETIREVQIPHKINLLNPKL